MSLPSHFWSKVDKTETCWLWTGTRTNGYGRFGNSRSAHRDGYSTALAYRIAWEDINGPVPDGLELDHECNNTACVNPAHLAPVTHQENMRRHFARRATCPNGHEISGNRVPHYESEGGDRCLICRRDRNREAMRRRRAARVPAGRPVSWNVRQWAWTNGYQVSRMGQVPKRVVQAYLAALKDVA